eukprot:gene11774-21300_t
MRRTGAAARSADAPVPCPAYRLGIVVTPPKRQTPPPRAAAPPA